MKTNARRIDTSRMTVRTIELRLDPPQPTPEERKLELERKATDYAVNFYLDPEMQR